MENLFNFDTEIITTNTTVYAKWKINSFILTFNSKGGTEIPQQTIKNDENAETPIEPTRDDYVFKGWYKEEALTVPFDFTKETIKSNTTLYAKWKKIDISFSMSAVASSLELEVKTALSLTDMGAIIRLANEAVPTLTEAQVSKGYVNLSIDADSTRKFSISQHYTTDFSDGLTLDDVLTPNTEYKLYLYLPSAIDLAQIVIKGGEIKENKIEISFTTASLPPAGDAIWNEKRAAKKYIASLNEYYFMENQTGVFIAYFQKPYMPFSHDFTIIHSSQVNAGSYRGSTMTVTSGVDFYFNYGLVEGYPATKTSQTIYVIIGDKVVSPILQDLLKDSATPPSGPFEVLTTPISRY